MCELCRERIELSPITAIEFLSEVEGLS
jgi:hypothetical protein